MPPPRVNTLVIQSGFWKRGASFPSGTASNELLTPLLYRSPMLPRDPSSPTAIRESHHGRNARPPSETAHANRTAQPDPAPSTEKRPKRNEPCATQYQKRVGNYWLIR